jgi:Nucleotidyl transferase AbiEii toxin, Type IV TA system
MFERPHHQRIAHVLAALDDDALRQHGCLFGGGTCIALRYGECRESVDIDFLVSDATGYRDLRQSLAAHHQHTGTGSSSVSHCCSTVTWRCR